MISNDETSFTLGNKDFVFTHAKVQNGRYLRTRFSSGRTTKFSRNHCKLQNMDACSYEGSLFGWIIQENQEQFELASTLSFGFNATLGANSIRK
jgi:hypothetical protein